MSEKLNKIMEATFKGETMEVGLYLAMAKKAELEGLADVAMYFRQLAMEEAGHACEVGTLLGKIKPTTKENIEYMLGGEAMATDEKAAAARIAREEGNNEAATFFDVASRDEKRHHNALEGFLKKLK
jgi:rubrerythrin